MKKKGLLLSLSLVACSAIAISVACLASKHVKIFNSFNASNTLVRNDAFEVDPSTAVEVDTAEYTAIATDNKGNSVNTMFVGFAHDSGGFKIAANKNMYFTNTQPMRGISNIHFSIDVANDYEPNFAYIVYGSSNPLVYEDIFNGYYYDDLQFYYNHFYESHVVEFDYASYYSAPSLVNCHYMMVIICNLTDDVIPINEISFSATCGEEPATKTNVQATAYKEASDMSDKGIPAYFPYLKTNGYTYNLEVDFGLQLGMVNTPDNAELFFNAAMADGYEYINMSVPGINLMLFQKQTGVTTLTMYLQYEMLNSSLLYGAFVYSDQIPYQGAPSSDTWPVQAIEDASTEALSLAFPAVTLTDAKYRVYERPDNGLYKAVYVEIQTQDEATTISEFAAYAAGLDNTIYSVANNYGTSYTITTLDGVFQMSGYVSSYMQLELLQYLEFDHFPIAEFNAAQNNDTALPVISDISGTFISDGATIVGTFDDNDGLDTLIGAFVAEGYSFDGNQNCGLLVPQFLEGEDFGLTALEYFKEGVNKYKFSVHSASIMPNASLTEALSQMMDEPEGSLDPITYSEEVKEVFYYSGIQEGYIFIEDGDSTTIQDIYDSINVSASSKSYNSTAKVIRYIVEDNDKGGEYAVISLHFYERTEGLYIIPGCDRQSSSVLGSLINNTTLQSQLVIADNYYDLPNGNKYYALGSTSAYYYGSKEEVRAIGEAYKATLIAGGYTLSDAYNGQYLAPSGYADVLINYTHNHGVYALYIAFINGSAYLTGYQNYEDAFENHAESVDVLAMLALFPDIFDKSDASVIYANVSYYADKQLSLRFVVNATAFAAGVIGQSLINTYGYQYRYGAGVWVSSLTFKKTDGAGNQYFISFYPSSSMATGEYGSVYSVTLEYKPAE